MEVATSSEEVAAAAEQKQQQPPQQPDQPPAQAESLAQIPQQPRQNKKKLDKHRRRDSRALENILKPFSEDKEKLECLITKYSSLYDEVRNLQMALTALDKKCGGLQREKDQLQSEQSKSVLARSRMESLCRELQRQNKLIREENMTKIREEEEKRKEVASKFQGTLNEVTNMMTENNDKNNKLREDNLEMASRIASLCQQFEKREEQVTRMSKQLDLEKQLSEATLAKSKLELKAEQEMWAKEREELTALLRTSDSNCRQLQVTVKALEDNLQVYTGKYEEFETTISKSNKVFGTYKTEIASMQKQTAALEKDVRTWKMRWKKSEEVVNELNATRQLQDAELASVEKRLEQLQKLCRQLQVDRASYLKLLKSNNIEPTSTLVVTTPAPPSAKSPPTSPMVEKPSAKKEELNRLKKNLRVLEEQFADLNSANAANKQTAKEDVQEITQLLDEQCNVQDVIANSKDENVNAQDENINVQDENINVKDENVNAHEETVNIQDINVGVQDVVNINGQLESSVEQTVIENAK